MAKNSGVPVTPPKKVKQLRFAAEDEEHSAEELFDSESEDESVLCTPEGPTSRPLVNIPDVPSPISFQFSPPQRLPGGYIPHSYYTQMSGSETYKPNSPPPDRLPSIHPQLNGGGTFVWDMATHPDTLSFMRTEGNDAAARDDVEKRPWGALIFGMEGIYQWPFVIESAGPEAYYPTLRDVFIAVHTDMMKFVAEDDFKTLHKHTQRRVAEARLERCRDFGLDPAREGLKRIDFLFGSRRFLGVAPSPAGNKLLLKVGNLPPRS